MVQAEYGDAAPQGRKKEQLGEGNGTAEKPAQRGAGAMPHGQREEAAERFALSQAHKGRRLRGSGQKYGVRSPARLRQIAAEQAAGAQHGVPMALHQAEEPAFFWAFKRG